MQLQLSINKQHVSYRWFHESSRWLVLSNKSDQAIKNLKSVARFNGRREEGEKIDIKVRDICVCYLIICLCFEYFELRDTPLLCVFVCEDAAGVHEERDVLLSRLLLCPGSVPHPHNEDHDNLPQCCLVRQLLTLCKNNTSVLFFNKITIRPCMFFLCLGYQPALLTTV